VEALALAAMVAFVIHHRRMRAYHNRFRTEMIEARRKESLSQVQRRYESAVRGANDGLWFWDLEAEQIYVSAKWAQMVGCPEGALRLSPDAWWDSVDPYYVDSLRSALNAHVEGASSQFEYKYRIRKQDGDHIWVLARGLATRDDNGVARSVAGSMTDISHVMDIEQQLVNDALQDKLTSLANRHRLMMDLQFAVEESRQDGKLIALIFLDLDDFKYVNDNLGHPVGDQLLTEIAKRLWTCTRPTDTLARYGGDEFVLLLNELSDANEAEDIGRQMQRVLAAPIEVGGHSLKVTASVGISINCPVVQQHEDLLRNADIAMYKAKAEGKGELRVFNSEMQSQARRSWELFNVVRGVVDREECSVHYQPIVSLDDGRVAGAEALFRWQGPKNAQRTTSELIIAAERTGSIIGIGEWVLRKVCADAVDWQRRGLTPIQVSANVSAHQLRLPGFPEIVKRILWDEGLDPHWLELELTETAFMHDIETVCGNLRRLVDLGVGLAIDDFGTGYSSLGYLAKFPLKTLKIDGSFVSDITVDPRSAALTRGIISLAHSLDLSVTAEKVENVRQLQFLTTEGCDCVQGYLASPALAADDMARILESDDRLLSTVPRKAHVSGRAVELVLLRQAVGN
jgi:diguanylate cyclase (GGDEF)-like protein/PAS domain S-box-containing protein